MAYKNKADQASAQRKHYAKKKQYYKDKASERRNKSTDFIQQLKEKSKCATCGEEHPATLDFHHRDPLEKDMSLSVACRNGWGVERLQKEIDKCVILCSNCHRKLHSAGRLLVTREVS